MINYESLLTIKNPCDFVVAWKSGQPEYVFIMLRNVISKSHYHILLSFVAAAVPKDWPYKKIFDIKLQRLLESGTLDSIRKHWENDVPDCRAVEEDEDSLALGPGVQRYSASKF